MASGFWPRAGTFTFSYFIARNTRVTTMSMKHLWKYQISDAIHLVGVVQIFFSLQVTRVERLEMACTAHQARCQTYLFVGLPLVLLPTAYITQKINHHEFIHMWILFGLFRSQGNTWLAHICRLPPYTTC